MISYRVMQAPIRASLEERIAFAATPGEAIRQQQALRDSVVARNAFGRIDRVAGVDVGFEEQGRVTRAAVVVMEAARPVVIESALVRLPTRFPYVPGLLSFREAPAILAALDRLSKLPDLIFCDGHGLAHPRRFGIACHLGLAADIPTIGVGKSRLTGTHAAPAAPRGSRTELLDGREVIGAVLRTRHGVRPVYVSTGHRVSLDAAVDLTLRHAPRYRLPEPIRLADRLASTR